MRRISGFPLMLVLLAILSSCTVTQELSIGSDGTGTGTMRLTFDPVVLRYIESIVSALGGDPVGVDTLFDVDSIRRGIDDRDGITATEVVVEDEFTLRIDFEISDISAIAPDAVVLLRDSDGISQGSSRLRVELDRRSFLSFSSMFLEADSPAAVLIPVRYSDFLPESEYRELVSYAFGEFLEGRSVDQLVSESIFRFDVVTDGAIADIEGGEMDDRTGVFEIPVINIVTLEEPILLTITWR